MLVGSIICDCEAKRRVHPNKQIIFINVTIVILSEATGTTVTDTIAIKRYIGVCDVYTLALLRLRAKSHHNIIGLSPYVIDRQTNLDSLARVNNTVVVIFRAQIFLVP